MSHTESLIVTALGMSVVFLGLLLCVGFIQVLGRIATRVRWGEGGHGDASHGAVSAPAAEAEPATPPEQVPDDVLAVIAAVIEVERKLYLSRPDAREATGRPALQS